MASCFFCEAEVAGRGYHEGKGLDGQAVAVAVCAECAPMLGTVLADTAEELDTGVSKTKWLRQQLAKVEATAWETLALNLDAGRVC